MSKRSNEFGTGIPEGVVAPESANNACVGGALIPMITLGIPGDSRHTVCHWSVLRTRLINQSPKNPSRSRLMRRMRSR